MATTTTAPDVTTLAHELEASQAKLDALEQRAETAPPVVKRRIEMQIVQVQQQIVQEEHQLLQLQHGVPENGAVIKAADTSTLYLVQDGQRRQIDARSLEVNGVNPATALTLTPDQMGQIPEGAPLPPYLRLLVDTGNMSMNAGHWMHTRCALSFDTSQVTGWTRTSTQTALGGFTGGLAVIATDMDDIPVNATSGKFWATFGVDGWLIGRNDRTDAWSFALDPADAKRVRHLNVFHTWAPPTFAEVMQKLTADAKSFYAFLAECADIVQIFHSQGDVNKTDPKPGV